MLYCSGGGVMSLVDRLLKYLKQRFCSHVFDIKDIENTNIPEPEKPNKYAGYTTWADYHTSYYDSDHVTKRIKCKCSKCGKLHYAHCGLELDGKLINTTIYD
jgi:hypothetical protein